MSKILTGNHAILLTAFRDTSSELLLKNAPYYQTIILPNDKIKDTEKLIDTISTQNYDYIISFGQRPNIKDKVHIETTAREGDNYIVTDFDVHMLSQLFEQNGLPSKLSNNAGTSYCNQLYYNSLKYIHQQGINTKMIFIHIPFFKNITDFNRFRTQIFKAIAAL